MTWIETVFFNNFLFKIVLSLLYSVFSKWQYMGPFRMYNVLELQYFFPIVTIWPPQVLICYISELIASKFGKYMSSHKSMLKVTTYQSSHTKKKYCDASASHTWLESTTRKDGNTKSSPNSSKNDLSAIWVWNME